MMEPSIISMILTGFVAGNMISVFIVVVMNEVVDDVTLYSLPTLVGELYNLKRSTILIVAKLWVGVSVFGMFWLIYVLVADMNDWTLII